MQRVQRISKDIDPIIDRFTHRDFMKQLNIEYERKVDKCWCRWTVCNHAIGVAIHYGPRLSWNGRDFKIIYKIQRQIKEGTTTSNDLSFFTRGYIGVCNSKGLLCADFPKHF